MKEIITAFRIGPILSHHEMHEFQGDLKTIDEKDLENLITEIVETGFAFAPYVWKDTEDGLWKICDAHQRKKALVVLEGRGFAVPKLQTIEVLAKDREEAKRRVLQATSQYGRVTVQGLVNFAKGAGIKFEALGGFRFPDIKKMSIVGEHLRDNSETDNDDGIYTKKIQIPIYQPTGEKPTLEQLVDRSKTVELIKEIDDAEGVPQDVKAFLRQSAQRHSIFDYEKIAEYYAHAPAEVQALMEKSALVIIDFNKAIENGFVAMSEKLIEAYKGE